MPPNGSARRSTIGLGCAGGVIEGTVYEIGALCALDEAVDGVQLHELDIYVGVSSGALVGSLLANQVSIHELSRGIVSEARDPSLNIKPGVLFRPALNEYASRLRQLPGTVLSSLRHYFVHPWDVSPIGLLSTFGETLPKGVFSNAPLERFLAQVLSSGGRTNDFRRLSRRLYVVAMHLDSADVVVFGPPERESTPISKAIQASTALPGLYAPVEIDGCFYIDGVARRTVHASVALDAGADLLFCVNPIVPVDVRGERDAEQEQQSPPVPASLADRGLPTVLSQTFRAIVDSRKETGFKKYEHTHPDADLLLIEPEYDDTRLFFSNIFSFQNRRDICEHAYQATREHLQARADEIAPLLRRHGLTLRTDVLDEERRLYEDSKIQERTHASSSAKPTVGEALHETDRALNRLEEMLSRIRAQM